jgi:NAD(P)-dependent dehydrogenase (short-subunit alcohol dehydrogenase family)
LQLVDKVFIVTGSGLGSAVAKRFAAAGACVILADLNGDAAMANAVALDATFLYDIGMDGRPAQASNRGTWLCEMATMRQPASMRASE